MEAIERMSARIKDIKLAGVPVGDALLILVGLGINDALVPAATRLVRAPIISGGLIAFLSKLPMIERFIGPTLASVISATAVATGIEDQIALRGRTHAIVSSLVGRVAPIAGIAKTAGASPSPAPVSLGQVISEQERRILESLKARG